MIFLTLASVNNGVDIFDSSINKYQSFWIDIMIDIRRESIYLEHFWIEFLKLLSQPQFFNLKKIKKMRE